MFPFGNNEAANANREAKEAHLQRLHEAGQIGDETRAACALMPGSDAIAVRRIGPVQCGSTTIAVTTTSDAGTLSLNLLPADARRIGIALIDAADEADGNALLAFSVDDVDPSVIVTRDEDEEA